MGKSRRQIRFLHRVTFWPAIASAFFLSPLRPKWGRFSFPFPFASIFKAQWLKLSQKSLIFLTILFSARKCKYFQTVGLFNLAYSCCFLHHGFRAVDHFFVIKKRIFVFMDLKIGNAFGFSFAFLWCLDWLGKYNSVRV